MNKDFYCLLVFYISKGNKDACSKHRCSTGSDKQKSQVVRVAEVLPLTSWQIDARFKPFLSYFAYVQLGFHPQVSFRSLYC